MKLFLVICNDVQTEESEIYHLKRGYDFNSVVQNTNFLLQICNEAITGKNKCIIYKLCENANVVGLFTQS